MRANDKFLSPVLLWRRCAPQGLSNHSDYSPENFQLMPPFLIAWVETCKYSAIGDPVWGSIGAWPRRRFSHIRPRINIIIDGWQQSPRKQRYWLARLRRLRPRTRPRRCCSERNDCQTHMLHRRSLDLLQRHASQARAPTVNHRLRFRASLGCLVALHPGRYSRSGRSLLSRLRNGQDRSFRVIDPANHLRRP